MIDRGVTFWFGWFGLLADQRKSTIRYRWGEQHPYAVAKMFVYRSVAGHGTALPNWKIFRVQLIYLFENKSFTYTITLYRMDTFFFI